MILLDLSENFVGELHLITGSRYHDDRGTICKVHEKTNRAQGKSLRKTTARR